MAPAIAVALWNYEEGKVDQANASKELAEERLEIEKNHESVDQNLAGKSSNDIVNDAIVNGGGDRGQLIERDKADSKEFSTSTDSSGTKKP